MFHAAIMTAPSTSLKMAFAGRLRHCRAVRGMPAIVRSKAWSVKKNSYVPFNLFDNNAAERALRRIGIGRKNWLFAGHDVAAQRAATLYSLIASAERQGVDPQRYLTGVLARIAATPTAQLDQYLPDVWKQE
jgi:hypothetical protein